MDKIEKNLLKQIADIEKTPMGAYNIRENGKGVARNTTANIDIVTKEDKPGIDIIIKPNTKNESVHIPVILTQGGLNDVVYNDFYIGERILNPQTIINLDENASMEMESVQIKGVTSTIRETYANMKKGSSLVISERIMTTGKQTAKTIFDVNLDGEDSSVHVASRSVAEDESVQEFISNIKGNTKCFGHVECDAIIMGNARVISDPKIEANDVDASLIHEAAIGKIAGEQLIKLMTLGLTEKEAEEQIINGFLK